jgi:hypothetical protein
MGSIRRIDRRDEPRTEADLNVCVWGIDVRGERFRQPAIARNVSRSGALLSQLETELRSGDVIGVFYAGRKARYKVIWVRYCGTSYKIQAAIHRLETDECPWQDLLTKEARESELNLPIS